MSTAEYETEFDWVDSLTGNARQAVIRNPWIFTRRSL